MTEIPTPKVPLYKGIPVYKDDLISKTRPERNDKGELIRDADGNVIMVEIICWKIMDDLHVHPDNWDKFVEMLEKGKENG